MPDLLQHWQARAGSIKGIAKIPKDEAVKQEVITGLVQALWASGPEYTVNALARLQAHYWRPDFSAAQAAEFYRDMIEDLEHLPPDILEEVCRRYRRDPEAKFFPRSAELLAIAEPILSQRYAAISNLRSGPQKPYVHPKRTEEEKERARALIKTAFHTDEELDQSREKVRA